MSVNEEFLRELCENYAADWEFINQTTHPDDTQEAKEEAERSFQAILQHFQQEQETTLKQGFYAGQANAGIKLEEAHKNWKEWSGYMLSNLKDKGGV